MADRAPGPDAPFIFTPDYYRRMRELEEGAWWNAGMRDVAASLLNCVDLPRRGDLLDVGCGSGQTMGWFRSLHPEWRAFGVDIAVEGLTGARAAGLTPVARASALELPVATASMDLVVTLDVLQHLPLEGGDARALLEIVRVLKPGGHVFVRTNGQSFPHVADDPVFQFHKYGADELRAKLTNAGLTVIRLGRLNALLGLAEIPREFRARTASHSYHGLLSQPARGASWAARLKRAYLRFEGQCVRHGASWPLGRTIVAICRR
jgi:SAM-dependent methyltransferase